MSNQWPATVIGSVEELDDHIREHDLHRPELAWRGMSNSTWTLRSSLDRIIRDSRAKIGYEHWIGIEKDTLERFRLQSLAFATDTDRLFLQTPIGPGIWDIMAIGRHCDLPTRLLDWTRSLWIAAYFACIQHDRQNGVLWWFSQPEFEDAIHGCWDDWGVPLISEVPLFEGLTQDVAARMGLHQRALHESAFADSSPPWISKIHFRATFPRLEAQQGFMTACGRLGVDHDRAIDMLPNADSIPRGRLILRASAKSSIIQRLMTYNLDARSLLWPGMDLVARSLRDKLIFEFAPREGR